MNFSENIIGWYYKNKRDLPWRNTNDPYLIWISEIILQQTRVEQGLPYYHKITEAFPTVKALASAKEDSLLKHWQGLGYYSRARNMHAASKTILTEHKGKFPSEYEKILKLKGIGPYTAAAISSFAFGKSHAVVDGNVARVLSRFFGLEQPIDTSVGQKELFLLANELIKEHDPATFNQAIMEFGAMQCAPKNPNCEKCPLSGSCIAFNKNSVDSLPIKSKKATQKKRYFNYLVISAGNEFTYLNKRTEKDIWQNLYEFPMVETKKLTAPDKIVMDFLKKFPENKLIIKTTSKTYKHILSHQLLFAKFIEVETKDLTFSGLTRVKKKNLNKYAVPRLVENYINKMEEDCVLLS